MIYKYCITKYNTNFFIFRQPSLPYNLHVGLYVESSSSMRCYQAAQNSQLSTDRNIFCSHSFRPNRFVYASVRLTINWFAATAILHRRDSWRFVEIQIDARFFINVAEFHFLRRRFFPSDAVSGIHIGVWWSQDQISFLSRGRFRKFDRFVVVEVLQGTR